MGSWDGVGHVSARFYKGDRCMKKKSRRIRIWDGATVIGRAKWTPQRSPSTGPG